MNTIYLCGAITGLSGKQARYGWRAEVHDALADTDIECISPMRHKDNLMDVSTLSPLGNPELVMSCASGLTARDRFDVARSDVLFCNLLEATQVSSGSMIEFGWADALRIPILCCIEADGSNPNEHAMLQELTDWRCGSTKEGIEVIRHVLGHGL